ncbi:hypothetical protein N7492_000131 [Penicillium capsulatum]|uniref:Uncharacterized protein n=1 Tax=Penicillium capsulatum TaxID=69766 RepID=A0A9W9LYQ2_9EURO|nr:hypothetical protein N7492_000131 [Penicillium capsulatum]KAJ6130803.1 hypothetical protein N7512_003583 [Penicillium capsulatum]
MYEPNAALDLHRLSRQSLQKRHESDEEDASESDAGGQDVVPSLVGSRRAGTLDSDFSADENSHIDPDSDREEHLLAPYSSGAKRPRPVSMDTVKQSRDATFVEDAYVFDPEEEMLLEIPSPDSPPTLGSNMFLQPSIYVSPNTPPMSHPRSRSPSPSPSSIFSLENAEIHVAKKVTLMEPPTRPALVFINSLGTRSKTSKPRPSHSRSRGNPRDRESRVLAGKSESELNIPRMVETQPTPPRASGRNLSPERAGRLRIAPETSDVPEAIPRAPRANASATINRVSEIPVLPYLPPSPLIAQSSSRSRMHLSGSERSSPSLAAGHARRPTEPGSRPSSIRSNSNISVRSRSRPESPYLDEARRGILDHSNPASAASSPATTHSSKRGPVTGPSTPNILGTRSQMMRRMTRTHSAASSIHSLTSLPADLDAPINPICTSALASSSQSSINISAYDSHIVRKPSQRRHARHNSSAPTARGFMGLKLGKKSFARA